VINCGTSLHVADNSAVSHIPILGKDAGTEDAPSNIQEGNFILFSILQHMQSFADRLRSVGSDISDQGLVLYTLQNLGFNFEKFVTVISPAKR
jgi:hypothetical protein